MPFQDFLASGTFLAPSNISGVATIQAVGRGGTGANGNNAGSVAGGGGGGGAYGNRKVQLVANRSYTVTINNTASQFADSVTGDILVFANKGGDGSGATPGTGGSLANAKGDVKFTGGNGGNGFTITSMLGGGGGGGACGVYLANGANGHDGTETNQRLNDHDVSGLGGRNSTPQNPLLLPPGFSIFDPLIAGGNGGVPDSGSCSSAGGGATGGYGSGGGGGSASITTTTDGAGGSGGPGVVRVEYDITFVG